MYNYQALAFIDTHGKQYHLECCNSIRNDVDKYLGVYGASFCARWGPKAEIRTMPSWEPNDFSLTIANGKKHTQAIAFNAQGVSQPIIGLRSTHHKVPISATLTLEIQELFQKVRASDGGRIFYHLVHTGYNVQGCVALSLVEEASKFSNFTLPHLL